MKKGYVRLLLISLTMLIIVIINSYMQIFSLYTYSLFLFLSLIITKFLVGFEHDIFINKKEIFIFLIINIILYYTITYFSVFYWGILKSRFVLSWSTFFKTVFPLFLIILFSEVLRYIIIRKGRKYKTIWLISLILFSLIDINLKMKGYDFSQDVQVIKFHLEVVVVCFAKNIFLCYLTYKAGYKATLTYRFLMDLILYFLPFFPDLGIFISAVSKVLFPNILLFIMITLSRKSVQKEKKKSNFIIQKIVMILVIIFAIIVVSLTSTKFKYFTIVVGSGSMQPNIYKGDIVLVKKVDDINTIKVNDILVFKYETNTIIHRVIKIEKKDNNNLYYTKGDANEQRDRKPVIEEDIVGIAIFKIKYLGYPTIYLYEKIS